MPQQEPLPTPLDLYPFHVREAIALGVDPARLRRRDLVAPFHGIRSVAPVATVAERCAAYLPLLSEQQCFSHATAAVLWGMWLPRRLRGTGEIHVTSVGVAREPRRPGVRGHRVSPGSLGLGMLGGIPLTAPVETWRLLSADLTVAELVEAGDSLVRRQAPLAAIDELAQAVRRHAGRRGADSLARSFSHVRSGADSPRETRLRLLLVRAGLPEPVVNLVVSKPGAAQTIFGDMVFPEYKVIAEYDGHQHRDDPRNYAADVLRLETLAREGWTVIRVLAEHFADPVGIVARVEGALRAHGWRPSRSNLQKLRRFSAIP